MNEIKFSLEGVETESDELNSYLNKRRKYCIFTNFIAIVVFFFMSGVISVQLHLQNNFLAH